MCRRKTGVAAVMMMAVAGCYSSVPVPDLPIADAAHIISRAPEFNRYARLISIERLNHAKNSMNFDTDGVFTFSYLGSPPNAESIEANVEFQFHEGNWNLNQFDYGCPKDCHYIYVHDGPDKAH